MRKPSPKPRPVGKLDRMTKQSVSRIWGLLYRALRRQSIHVDELTEQVRRQQRQLNELVRRVERAQVEASAAHRMSAEALATYYNTHDTITGEHVGGGVVDPEKLVEEAPGVGKHAPENA